MADFGAIPNDGKDDLASIRAAIEHAKKIGAKGILFDSGVYELHVSENFKDELILLDSLPDFSFLGAASEGGEPKTVLRRVYEQRPYMEFGYILKADRCPNLSVKNIEFDNSPRFFVSAEVLENDGMEIILKVLDGSPYIDGTYLYCANLWNRETKNLKNKPSVTYGGDVDSDRENFKIRVFGDPSERLMRLKNPKVARMCEVGEVLSWHFNWQSSSMCHFQYCDNLSLENILITNGISGLVGIHLSENVNVKNVKFIPDKNGYPVGSRDGLHFAGCRGKIVIDGFVCEAVRWDGINIHGSALWVKKIVGPKTAVFVHEGWGCGENDFIPGYKVGFCFDRQEKVLLTMERAKFIKSPGGLGEVEVTFKENLPERLDSSTVCNVYSLTAEQVVIKNSSFKNIAGTAAIFRNDNVLVENCSFENIMFPAICFGAALGEHEGVVCKNGTVRNCVFKNCGWMPRHSACGAIVAKVQECEKVPKGHTPYMKNIILENNKVYNCAIGFQLEGVDGLFVCQNIFTDVSVPIKETDNLKVSLEGNSFE